MQTGHGTLGTKPHEMFTSIFAGKCSRHEYIQNASHDAPGNAKASEEKAGAA
jgi:hypothetical protein